MRLLPLLIVWLAPLSAQQTDVQAFVPELRPLERIQPAWPEPARSQGIQGSVRLLVTVDAQGGVVKVEALTGPEVLRPPATDAVRQWRFRPVIRNGRPVAAYTDQIVVFRDSQKPPTPGNPAEEMAATQRLSALKQLWPRSPQQILADLEQDSSGIYGMPRFYLLTGLAKAAVAAGAVEKATAYAGELLAVAAQNPRDWNYGNAIHNGNTVLGQVALRNGDVPRAKSYLLEAARTPGSPQLNSFGPNVTLAKELIEKGEREAALQYFAICRTFWKMGGTRLDGWTATVRGGGIPEFGPNLVY